LFCEIRLSTSNANNCLHEFHALYGIKKFQKMLYQLSSSITEESAADNTIKARHTTGSYGTFTVYLWQASAQQGVINVRHKLLKHGWGSGIERKTCNYGPIALHRMPTKIATKSSVIKTG